MQRANKEQELLPETHGWNLHELSSTFADLLKLIADKLVQPFILAMQVTLSSKMLAAASKFNASGSVQPATAGSQYD